MPIQEICPDRSVLRSRLCRAALIAAPMMLSILPAAAYAQVKDAPTGPIVSGFHNNKCVDDLTNSNKNKTPVVISDCDGSAEQNWTVAADGTLQINGKCMDVFRKALTSGTKVELFDCNGGKNQQWQANAGQLVNPVSGKCLDIPRFIATNGTQLIIYTCTGKKNQQWTLPAGMTSDGHSSRAR